MREIKFRAWDDFNKQMTEPIDISQSREYWLHDWLGVYDFPIMQFTGLKDKNGKEIYEGDVIRFKRSGYMSGNWQGIGVIEWDKYHTKFYYVMKKSEKGECYNNWDLFPDTNYEIIGNIYENPELLENRQ